MKALCHRFRDDQSGATAIEYGLIAAMIAVSIIGAMSVLGTTLSAKFAQVSANLT